MSQESLEISRQELEQVVAAEGLRLLGCVPLAEEGRYAAYLAWLAAGKQAEMAYMAENLACRQDPRHLLAGSQSALILAMPYYQGDKYAAARHWGAPRVAQYARLRDYHKVYKQKAQRILDWLLSKSSEPAVGRVLVDSAPLLERALAAKTAAGFIGKNTLYIHPKQGSYLLLGEILTSLRLSYDQPPQLDPTKRSAAGGCGSCKRCQVHCPTGALSEDYSLDARRCLAYYTIEHRGPIPLQYWPWLRYYVFGCDICQLVCPYNRQAQPLAPAQVYLKALPTLAEIALMDQRQYVQWFAGTPLTRAKRSGLRRNALIAMVVGQDPRLEEVLAALQAEGEPLLLQTMAQIAAYERGG